MVDGNNSITLVSCTDFKWTTEIQYRQSLPSRDEAIRYATRHGCNLIVQYHRRSGPLFDVMNDPDLNGVSSVNGEHAETIPAEQEPEPTNWGELVLQSIAGLAKRLGGGKNTPS